MGTQKYVQLEMKFSQRAWPAGPGAPPEQPIDEETALPKAIRDSSARLINFFEAHDRSPAGCENSGKEFEINQRTSEVAARRLTSVERVDRLEESLYWLFSAAALVCVLLEIIGR
jgi:hypothetical protein